MACTIEARSRVTGDIGDHRTLLTGGELLPPMMQAVIAFRAHEHAQWGWPSPTGCASPAQGFGRSVLTRAVQSMSFLSLSPGADVEARVDKHERG